jgi:hypothetical protein
MVVGTSIFPSPRWASGWSHATATVTRLVATVGLKQGSHGKTREGSISPSRSNGDVHSTFTSRHKWQGWPVCALGGRSFGRVDSILSFGLAPGCDEMRLPQCPTCVPLRSCMPLMIRSLRLPVHARPPADSWRRRTRKREPMTASQIDGRKNATL